MVTYTMVPLFNASPVDDLSILSRLMIIQWIRLNGNASTTLWSGALGSEIGCPKLHSWKNFERDRTSLIDVGHWMEGDWCWMLLMSMNVKFDFCIGNHWNAGETYCIIHWAVFAISLVHAQSCPLAHGSNVLWCLCSLHPNHSKLAATCQWQLETVADK